MYCKKCYTDLSQASTNKCPKCGREFDPANPKRYLKRPFPGAGRIVGHIILTTIVGIAAAFVVAVFQLAQTSGH